MSLTIKKWVTECLSETDNAETIWRSCQDKFPYHKVSWGYVRKLVREFKEARLAMDATQDTEADR